ncbi:MAG TPA: twin-arginine translocation signal domain-containing protein, partial [Flavobacteriales bacterium]|nr:twin-arginine translocation signal domain-containing protein [Flavobacteriales bacterium]
MSKLNRRDFIKLSGTASAGLAMTPPMTSLMGAIFGEEKTEHLLENEAIKTPTVCEVCF